ncbi:MAG: leucine-rich repeat domain-containing protein, partial [Thermoguttaceae bacterium]|nr:leucine-rich repeat domain-containing protein [Thermoguttaceae bacterium]
MLRFLIPLTMSASVPTPTSRDSFRWEGRQIDRFIGEETEVVIPEGAEVITFRMFSDAPRVKSVVIPDGVKKIKFEAFSNCKALKTVVIPDSVEKIDQGAFVNCPALKKWTVSPTHPLFKSHGSALLSKDGKTLTNLLNVGEEYQIPKGV